MRRNKQIQPQSSPNLKLHLKSPPPRTSLKQTSPITSHRSNSKKRLNYNRGKSDCLSIWVPDSFLFSFLSPLNRIDRFAKSYQFKDNVEDRQMVKKAGKGDKIWIISNIDAFVEVYMHLNDSVKLECEKWFVVSAAVNSKEMEDEFNQLYFPIKFCFLPSLSSLCNSLLGKWTVPTPCPLRAIYNLSQQASTDNISCQDICIERMEAAKVDCLYIVKDSQQWVEVCSRMKSKATPYFVTGSDEILKSGHIVIKALEPAFNNLEMKTSTSWANCHNPATKDNPELSNLVYLCLGFETNFKNLRGFAEFQEQFRNTVTASPQELNKLNINNELYMAKIISGLLIPRMKICLFMDPLPAIPIPELQSLGEMLPSCYIFPSRLYVPGPTCYHLEFNTRTRSCNSLCLSTTAPIQHQISKMMKFIEDKEKMLAEFKGQEEILRKMNIVRYCRDEKGKHCITDLLERANIKIGVIDDIGLIMEVQKVTLVFGHFRSNQIEAMAKFYNVGLVPISKQAEDTVASNQIQECRHFLQKSLSSYTQLCSDPANPPRYTQIHALYENETQIGELLADLKPPEHQLKTHYIPTFHTELTNFQENNKHILICHMDIFSEALEKIIREFQWKFTTISIEVYLKYGKEFIFRNKEGNYKFIKAKELQHKIEAGRKTGIIETNQKSDKKQKINFQSKDEMNSFLLEESAVEPYPSQDEGEKKHEDMENKSESSFIKLLSESFLNAGRSNTNSMEELGSGDGDSSLVGAETANLIQQTNHKRNEGNNIFKQISSNQFSKVKEELIMPIEKMSDHQSSRRNSKNGCIRQHRQAEEQDIYLTSPKQATNLQEQQTYKLYIFIHRSVPHYSLARRQQKDYHILLYTRIEEVIMFSRYLKSEEKIVVLANEQSQKIYTSVIEKAGVEANRLRIVFHRDLGENFIRTQVDKILGEECLFQIQQKKATVKSFRALVIYSSQNQRVHKEIKAIKKMFGIQMKIQFLRQTEFDQMSSSGQFNLKLCNNVEVYQIGLTKLKSNQAIITSIRELLILVMHPDLKTFTIEYGQLKFSIEAYLGRMLYGTSQKNYAPTQKGGELRKKMLSIKSESNFFKTKESHLSHFRQNSQRRMRSPTNRSSLSKSSSIFWRSSPTVSIIASSQLHQYFPSKISFDKQEQLLSQIFYAYSCSKFVIAVLTEREYDMFDIFQHATIYELSREVVWVIETKIQGKKVFMGTSVVFAGCDNLREVVEGIMKEYEIRMHFENLLIESKSEGIQSGKYGELKSKEIKYDASKTLKISVRAKLTEADEKLFEETASRNEVFVTLASSKSKRKTIKNLIEFNSMKAIKDFCEAIAKRFESGIEIVETSSIGSMILVPSQILQKVTKMLESLHKKNIAVRIYDPQNLGSLVCYSLMRVLILADKHGSYKYMRKCSYVLDVDASLERVSDILAATLL